MSFETCPFLNDIPWIRHGFFGRKHPVTRISHGFREQTGYPALLNIDDCPILFLNQKRADTIVTTDDIGNAEIGADAAISDKKNIGLAVCTADCVPLFLVCTKTKQIANVHSGWQGTLLRIATKTATRMIQNGAEPDHMIAALGPSILPKTYPVQDDVRDQFAAIRPETLDNFKPFEDRWCMDIPSMVVAELKELAITQIWQSSTNVFTSTDYFSWRRRHTDPTCLGHWNASIIIKTGDAV